MIKHPIIRFVTFILSFLLGSWTMGLILFVMVLNSFDQPSINDTIERTDAIIVLTGGSDRIKIGLDLIKAKKAEKLFISGIHKGLKTKHILAKYKISQALRNCCITTGDDAEDTVGNAKETHLWIRKQAPPIKSIRLVTSNYHMLRSLLLFQKEMPDIKVIPHTVTPNTVHLPQWWTNPGTAQLLVTEYNKYLVALASLEMEPYL